MPIRFPRFRPGEPFGRVGPNRELILDARNIAVDFKVEGGIVQAVRDVSFQLHKGETIALVGESGSGKSVTARTIMGLLTKRASISPKSTITLNGEDILKYSEPKMRALRGNKISMIFQEPMSSLNPRRRVRASRAAPRISADPTRLCQPGAETSRWARKPKASVLSP